MGDVAFSEVLREQCLDRARYEGLWLLPEQSAGLTIGVSDNTLPIYRDDRIGQQLE
jgi:hypothetical protein